MTSVSRAAQTSSPCRRPRGGAGPRRTSPAAAPLFDNYLSPDRPNPGAYDEMFSPDGSIRAAVPRPARGHRAHGRGRPQGALRGAGPGLRRPGHHVLALGQGAAVPARHRAPGDQRGGVDRSCSAASSSASRRWRCSSPTSTATPRSSATACCPGGLITSCEHFHRTAAGLVPPNGVRIHVAGIDLVRDEQGVFRVLEDNLRNPSGVSYVMENRRTMARVFPDLFTRQRVRTVGDYGTHLLRALRAAAAPNEADPDRRRAHPRRLQLGLLRALAAGPPDGRRAGRGPRPVLPRQPRLHAHHAGRPAGGRDLPADRRRVPRPAAVQPGLGARRRRA